MERCKDMFSKDAADIGDIKDFQMPINLVDKVPVTAAYQKIPPNLYNEVRNYIEDMRTNGWIRESYLSYLSPIVCVRNKDGSFRLCIDYRKLNAKTIPDSQPIPQMQDILTRIEVYVCVLALRSCVPIYVDMCRLLLLQCSHSDEHNLTLPLKESA